MKGTIQTITKVNTIRLDENDEPAGDWRSRAILLLKGDRPAAYPLRGNVRLQGLIGWLVIVCMDEVCAINSGALPRARTTGFNTPKRPSCNSGGDTWWGSHWMKVG